MACVARMRATAPACLATRPVAPANALPTPRAAIHRTNVLSALAPATRLATARALVTIRELEHPAGTAVRAVMATECVWMIHRAAPAAGAARVEGAAQAASVARPRADGAARMVRAAQGGEVARAAQAATAGPEPPTAHPMLAARILSRLMRPNPMARAIFSRPTRAAAGGWATKVAPAIWASLREARLDCPWSCWAPRSCCGADVASQYKKPHKITIARQLASYLQAPWMSPVS
jgi:hypothetical protein